MKFVALALSPLLVLSVLSVVGCAASSENSGAGEDDVTASSRPRITMPSSNDPNSLQGSVFQLLTAFKGDDELRIIGAIESPALLMSGGPEANAPTRTITCFTSPLAQATPSFSCTLDGFDKIRNGGALPRAFLSTGEAPLAGKLFALLEKGEQKGGFAIKRSPVNPNQPTCCDVQLSTTLSIVAGPTTLQCTMVSGGIAGLTSVECSFTNEILPNQEDYFGVRISSPARVVQ